MPGRGGEATTGLVLDDEEEQEEEKETCGKKGNPINPCRRPALPV